MNVNELIESMSDKKQIELFAQFVVEEKINPYSESGISDELLETFNEWLGQFCDGKRRMI